MSSAPGPPGFLPPDPKVEEPYRVTPQMAIRIAIVGVVAIALFAVLFFRLWALQVISGDEYLAAAQNNQVRTFRLPAPRGPIVDRDGEVLVTNRAGTLVQLWPAAVEAMEPTDRAQMLRRLSKLLNLPLKDLRAAVRKGRADPVTPVTIRESVRDEKVNYLLEHQAKFPGVKVQPVQLRRYPFGSLAAHLLGHVGEISAEQLKARRGKGYAPGDRIGQSGVEGAFDRYLRGVPGVGEVRVDALGRVTSRRQFSQFPEAGYALRLTLDAGLQRAAEDALAYGIRLALGNGEWAANGGAIVAMDPSNGEVLAMVSSPTFDPSIYVGRVDPRKLARLADPAQNHPALNRSAGGLYPPGSTFKPVTALAAIEESFLSPTELLQCTGRMEIGEDKQEFRNWNPFINEPMELTTAIASSCDTYFYQVALRAYARPDTPIQAWAKRVGFGEATGFELGPEGDGLIPTPAWRRRTFDDPVEKIWTNGDSVQLSIGQGDVLVTPLQMTRFYALVANGGKLVEPTIVKQVEQAGTETDTAVVVRHLNPAKPHDVGLDPAGLAVIRQGLYDATHATYGTSTSVFGQFPVPIAGKTGTAEKFVRIGSFKGLRDQSWWCGYGPSAEPELVVCAVIENGGHGGEAAAPAAVRVFEHYFGVAPGSYPTSAVETD